MEYAVEVDFYDYSENKRQFVYSVGRHATLWTLFAVEQGTFEFTINGVTDIASLGDIVVCPPDIDLYRKVISAISVHYLGFRLTADRSDPIPDILDGLTKSNTYKIVVKDQQRFFSTLQFLKNVSDKQTYNSLLQRTHYVNDLWMLIVYEHEENKQSKNRPDMIMKKAKQWIDDNAYKTHYLKDLASLLSITRVELTRKYRLTYGMTPKEYVTHLKMDKAKALLSETDYTIEHIAGLCGYDSGCYFSRVFYNFTHIRPSAYRKKYRL